MYRQNPKAPQPNVIRTFHPLFCIQLSLLDPEQTLHRSGNIVLNLLAPEFYIYILAHPGCKM
jgi:hypothetical protein